jgi:hypothetical protein
MRFFSVFQSVETNVPGVGNLEIARARLQSQTDFQETMPKNWDTAVKEKQFIGIVEAKGFTLLQRPIGGTRYGAFVMGWINKNDGSATLRTWINPRARGKIIFGYLLAVLLIARLAADYYSTGGISDFNKILPYALIAVLPMNWLASLSYLRARNRALETVKGLLAGNSSD